ncbi:hypothetical protein XENTR_v10004367, partial [Xenopus tropicalis]
MLLSMNPGKALNIHSPDMAQVYWDGESVEKPPSLWVHGLLRVQVTHWRMNVSSRSHIFAVAEDAYSLSQTSDVAPNILLSGHSGSGKSEAVKLMALYLVTLSTRQEEKILQLEDFLKVLESFGNAKTVFNDNSTRFGQVLQLYLH